MELNRRYMVDISLILLIVFINMYLLVRRLVTDRKNKAYITYFKEIYSDFVKYLCIELGIAASHYIELGEFSLIASSTRISIIMLALLVYHELKYNFIK